MLDDKTLRERVAVIEGNNERLAKLIKDYEGLENIHLTLIKGQENTNKSILELSKQVEKMAPIINEIIQVKGYGSFSWKALKWLGGVTIATIALWDKIKHLAHYLFS